MDVYGFLHSPDVAEYCKKIGHIFNPVEIAYLIETSGRTINEKNKLFQELVDNYPDMEFHQSVDFYIRSGLHDYLRALIEWNKNAMEFFYQPNRDAQKSLVYRVCSYDLGEMGLGPKIDPIKDFMKKPTKYKSFNTAEELLEDIRPHWNRDKMSIVRIFIKRIRQRTHFEFYADVNFDGEIIRLDDSATIYGIKNPGHLWELFIHIPVPFQVGDIVSSSCENGMIPYVLKSLPQCKKGSVKDISGADYTYYLSQANSPGYATLYFITQDGHLANSFPYFDNNSPWSQGWGWYTYDLQYYNGKFEGATEILPYLSDYIKKKGIKKVPEWVRAFHERESQ